MEGRRKAASRAPLCMCAAAVFGVAWPVHADMLYLSEDRILEGVVIREDAKSISFEMDGASVWTLSRDTISRVEREDPGEYWLRIAERHARASRFERARTAFLRAAQVETTADRATRRLKDLDLLDAGSSAALAYSLRSIEVEDNPIQNESPKLADPPKLVPPRPAAIQSAAQPVQPPEAAPAPERPAPKVVQKPAARRAGRKTPTDTALLVRKYARLHGVDPILVEAIIQVESNGNPNATSTSGAQGLMQLMPETASYLGVRNAYDPEQNINAGVKYIRMMLDEFSHLEWEERRTQAVAAYHAGPNKLKEVGDYRKIPATLRYTQKVAAAYDALYRAKRQEVAFLNRLLQPEVD